ncbi:hypothetical protein GE09DRAFT_178282 [Coniochaeta sp. 2T2.1]|nr:hypothetical protein GE09DRAFT_178282 [Coniochaeta sp. 2T2.1]
MLRRSARRVGSRRVVNRSSNSSSSNNGNSTGRAARTFRLAGAPTPALYRAAYDDVGVPVWVWLYEWVRHYYLERWGNLTERELTELRRHVPYLDLSELYTLKFWVEFLWVAWPILLASWLIIWFCLVFYGIFPMPGLPDGETAAAAATCATTVAAVKDVAAPLVAAANPTSRPTITPT